MSAENYHGTAKPATQRIQRCSNQCQRLLAVRIAAYPGTVSLLSILDIKPRIAQFSARLHELRHRHGYDIEHVPVTGPNGERWSSYRLKSLLPDPRIAPSPALVPRVPIPRTVILEKKAAAPDSGLFGNDATWRERRAIAREMRSREAD